MGATPAIVEAIFDDVRRLGVELTVVETGIQARPLSRLSPTLRQAIAANREAVRVALRHDAPDATVGACGVCGDEGAAYFPDGSPVCERHHLRLAAQAVALGARVCRGDGLASIGAADAGPALIVVEDI